MDVIELRTDLHSMIDKITDRNVLNAAKTLLAGKSGSMSEDWWGTISEDERAEIEQGLAEAERGEVSSHEEVMSKYKNGYKNPLSRLAEQGYANIVKYLKEEWTNKEVEKFIRETNHFFKLLMGNPYMLEPSKSQKNLYRGPINRLTVLTYRYKPRKKEIF
jgi:predicted transcriptional regulator/plasmid stabilization system protein ParE